jgi:AhpD family alkylhydroperoxidase
MDSHANHLLLVESDLTRMQAEPELDPDLGGPLGYTGNFRRQPQRGGAFRQMGGDGDSASTRSVRRPAASGSPPRTSSPDWTASAMGRWPKQTARNVSSSVVRVASGRSAVPRRNRTETGKGGVPQPTLELVHLRASQINACSACVDAGARSAKKASETDDRLFAVAAWREAPYFTDAERAVLALAEQLPGWPTGLTRYPTRSGTRPPGTTTSRGSRP